MIISSKRKLALSLLAVGSMFAGLPQAQAAATWNFSSGACQTAIGSGSSVGNTAACAATSGTGPNVTLRAYGAGYVNSTTATTTYQTANLSAQSGNGVAVKSGYELQAGSGSPQHALDNSPTNAAPDLILLKFDTAVALSLATIGWSYNDADFTIMAYTGGFAAGLTTDAAKANSLIVGKSAGNLTGSGAASGWTLIENSGENGYAAHLGNGVSSDTNTSRTVNNGDAAGGAKNVVSSWWVISAYNSGFGDGSLDSFNDYIKLLSIASKDVPQGGTTPEPGSLALASMALLGLVYSGRRRRKH